MMSTNNIEYLSDGVFIKAPCKIGDPIWFIQKTTNKPYIIETSVEKIVIKKGGLYLKLECNSFYETAYSSVNKTVFFNKEAAEEKLKELSNSNMEDR